MAGKHTPGPWVAHFEEAYFVTGPDHGRVAMMMNLKGRHGLGGRRTGEESAANNRLIAAAPDLLEALRQAKSALVAFKFMPGPGNAWEDHDEAALCAVNAALAKATGGEL